MPDTDEAARVDRRVSRTEHSLHGAMMRLVLEKGYGATTVREIAERANVGRSTLYEHHGGKEGVLLSGIRDFRALLLKRQREAVNRPTESHDRVLGFSRTFFEHVGEYRDVFHALVRHGEDALVLGALRKMLTELVKNELPVVKRAGGPADLPRSAVVRFVVDAFVSMMLWWLEQEPARSPAEANAAFRQLTIGALTAARLV